MPPQGYWLNGRKVRVLGLILGLLLVVWVLSRFFTVPFVVSGRSDYDLKERERVEQEIKILELEDKVEKYEGKENKLYSYLKGYGSPFPRSFVRSAIRVEHSFKIEGLSHFIVALSGTESTFGKRYPTGSFNPFGLCSPSPDSWCIYNSYEDSIKAVAKKLEGWGVKKINEKEIWRVCSLYSECVGWGDATISFWRELEGI